MGHISTRVVTCLKRDRVGFTSEAMLSFPSGVSYKKSFGGDIVNPELVTFSPDCFVWVVQSGKLVTSTNDKPVNLFESLYGIEIHKLWHLPPILELGN